MSWVGFLPKHSELFTLFAENTQIIFKIYVMYSHSLNFHLSGLLVNNQLNS